jgi:uncharacterized protein YjbI with pentapeptide repeats
MRRRNPDVKIVNGHEIKPRADLRGVFFATETDLRGADLEGAKMANVFLSLSHLEGAILTDAYLDTAFLESAHLEGAHLERANLYDARLKDANLSGAYLQKALLHNTDLSGANLTGANLEGASLFGARLYDADFTDANLSGADLASTDLSGAILTGAIFDGAIVNLYTTFPSGYDTKKYFPKYFVRANFAGADLRNADFSDALLAYANLSNANLEGANLEDARLSQANLRGAHLEGANLEGARFHDAYLQGAHLEGASLEDATLNGANLEGAHLEGANLKGANLYGAKLDETDFTDADLTYANIVGTDLSKAILTGAILTEAQHGTFTTFPADFDRRRLVRIYGRRSYGEMTGSVLKLGKPDSPQRAADFKRKYPAEFDRLIKDTGGKDFTDSVKKSIRDKYRTPFDWYVTYAKYRSAAQRLSYNNEIMLLNIDLKKVDATEKQIGLIQKLANVSRNSSHPHQQYPLFTIGWVRFDVDEMRKTYLVEEVQSDLQVVRQQTKEDKAQNQLRNAGIPPEDFDALFETLRPYTDRFYEDALGILFMEAEEKGYSVEMLGYEDKKKFKSPRSVYTDLPRKMGMRPQPTQTDLKLQDKVSYYKPNPSRPRRRY